MVIFSLIKNELIKIMKRPKTWIVFALFSVCIVGSGILSYYSAKNSEYYHSPKGQIEQLNRGLEYANSELKDIENSTDIKDKETRVEEINLRIQSINNEIAQQQAKIDSGYNKDSWKDELKTEKEDLEKSLNDLTLNNESKLQNKKRIDEINICLKDDLKPVENWEFDGVNYLTSFISTLGIVILAAGIAVFMSDIVSGESTPPTLKFLLVQPISRGKVLLSKFIAVVITVVGMISSLELIGFGVVGAIGGFNGAKMPQIIGQKFQCDYTAEGRQVIKLIENSGTMSTRGNLLFESFLLQILFIIACCAFIFAISSIFKSSMTTMALSVIITVVATMASIISSGFAKIAHLIFLNYGSSPSILSGDIVQIIKNPNLTLGNGVIIMLITIVVSYVIGHVIFNKKDILI